MYPIGKRNMLQAEIWSVGYFDLTKPSGSSHRPPICRKGAQIFELTTTLSQSRCSHHSTTIESRNVNLYQQFNKTPSLIMPHVTNYTTSHQLTIQCYISFVLDIARRTQARRLTTSLLSKAHTSPKHTCI